MTRWLLLFALIMTVNWLPQSNPQDDFAAHPSPGRHMVQEMKRFSQESAYIGLATAQSKCEAVHRQSRRLFLPLALCVTPQIMAHAQVLAGLRLGSGYAIAQPRPPSTSFALPLLI
jgi:hypothetical protein